jgi:hypothetical protein
MDSTRKIPLWLWWIVGLAILVALVLFGVSTFRTRQPTIPPGLVEKRQEVGEILLRSADADDIDIRPLVELESKKEYGAAVSLMDRALAANAIKKELNASLVTVAGELAGLAVQVKPDDAGAKAVEAFSLLQQFAESDRMYYHDRETLYQMTHDYYSALLAKQSPPIPDNLGGVVETVNADLAKTNTLNEQFASAIQAFDAFVAAK